MVDAASGDYCLAAGASGVDTAVATSLSVTDDFRAAPRPLGSNEDVGSFECR